ncbi:Sec-independent protein translocase protein TatB [Brevundimonas variabilis]|uniref:Sec-independent protein translocase protein TatB n=1 Tax=Brevundimonas variabilis TaxID=74312 RepID=A0A7W9CHS2_9CAUL|nr:Sec-independent protein translocase protein TatB [Brevundimonas variabilis]MBB5745852.1 sec-independent protein translocase protein TatB [Brevundimonas variabilis]
MGGLGPGIGGLEYLVIAAVALIVVGPERLPGLLRQLGKMIGKARRMADEFRSSFDEMARQSELDELRKEVEALRTNQSMVRLGDEADAAFKDISTELHKPVDHDAPRAVMAPEPEPAAAIASVDEWPDAQPVMMPTEPAPDPAPQAKPKTVRKASSKSATAGAATLKTVPARARAPRKSKLDL